MIHYFAVIAFFFGLSGTGPKVAEDLANTKYLNFVAAIENNSTFSYFTVVKVKNVNTGEVKEICVNGNFLIGALHTELKKSYENDGIQSVMAFAKSKKDLFFEFRDKKALENISFFNYDPKRILTIQKEYDVDKIEAIIKRDKKFSLQLSDHDMKLLAHILFNRGYLTGESDCIGGRLEYVNKEKRN